LDLNKYVEGTKLVSRLELRLKIRELIEKYKINELEKVKRIEKEHEIPILQYLFNSVTTTPISINSPSLTEKMVYKNVYFYHSHTQKNIDQLIKNAFKRYREIAIDLMKKIIYKIYKNANYEIELLSKTELRVKKENFIDIIKLYSTSTEFYDDLKSGLEPDNLMILIPQGATPAIYFNLYREFSDYLLLNECQVLLVNIEKKFVSPFIGFPEDKSILKKLKVDRNITLIKSRWQNSLEMDDF